MEVKKLIYDNYKTNQITTKQVNINKSMIYAKKQITGLELFRQLQINRMKPLEIKIQFYFTFLLFVLFFISSDLKIFAQNINKDASKNQLNFSSEYGFITKEEGLTFLIANSLIDTANLKEWNKIRITDTIGKYYRIENSDNYLICLPYSLDFFKPKYLIIKISSDGQLLKNEKYDFGNIHHWDSYYKDFFKEGVFWGIIAQGGYINHTYGNLYLFEELLSQDSLSSIPLFEDMIFYKNIKFSHKKRIKNCTCNFYISNGELIVTYKFFIGKVKETKDKNIIFSFRCFPKNKFTIKYVYKNKKWITKDTKHLDKIEKFMKIKPSQFIL